MNNTIQSALHQFGISALRKEQETILPSIFEGKDVCVRLQTGGGKSLLFQLPALLDAPGALTLVFSPLRALQHDQVSSLERKGIHAAWLNSDLSNARHATVLHDFCTSGGLLYLAPEQLQNDVTRDALLQANIVRVVVDEAHILLQVSKRFRKAYRNIGPFISALPNRPQVLAFTATATRHEMKQISKYLHMQSPAFHLFPVVRPNVKLHLQKIKICDRENRKMQLHRARLAAIEDILETYHCKGATIIFCPTVRDVKHTRKWLTACGYSVQAYYGSLKRKKRLAIQEDFLTEKCPILVATNAFGLGIDRPDIRLIIHAGLPLGITNYVQEIGRAGRDGKRAHAFLLFAKQDIATAQRIIRRSGGKKTVRRGKQQLYALQELVQSERCLWKHIGKYFGQKNLS